MTVLLYVLSAFALGYVIAWRRGESKLADACRDRFHGEPASAGSVPDRSAYDAAYPPEQREANRKQLELMDAFAALQNRRNELIKAGRHEDAAFRDTSEMTTLKLETIAVLERLIEYEPEGFYRDVYDALVAEQAGADGTSH